jgi:hypothetical protein
MVATPLVDTYIDAGRRLIQALDESGFEIEAALWLYHTEPNEWRLLLALPLVDEIGPREVYRKIQAQVSASSLLTLRNVSVVSPEAEIIRLLRGAVKTGPGISTIRLSGNVFDGVFVDDALVYRL